MRYYGHIDGYHKPGEQTRVDGCYLEDAASRLIHRFFHVLPKSGSHEYSYRVRLKEKNTSILHTVDVHISIAGGVCTTNAKIISEV